MLPRLLGRGKSVKTRIESQHLRWEGQDTDSSQPAGVGSLSEQRAPERRGLLVPKKEREGNKEVREGEKKEGKRWGRKGEKKEKAM